MQHRLFFRGARARALELACLLALLPAVSRADKHQRPPRGVRIHDVVLLVLDDVAAADLAIYGGPVPTPHLARLASAGVTFRNAYANPVCEPTRRTLQYGRWWLRGNGDNCTNDLSPDTPPLGELSLAEALPAHASTFVGKWHLGAVPGVDDWECDPLARGYERWLAGLPSNVLGELRCMGSHGYREWLRAEAGPGGCTSEVSTEYHPRVVLNSFLTAWASTPSPRFFSVNPNLAHAPFHRPSADLLPPGYPPTSTDRERYEAMIRALDEMLGRMLAQIDLERTLVVVVGDNGTPSSVAPDPARAKNTTFERGIRVPLVIAGGPTRKPGRVSRELVHVADLWSTIVEAGGGDPSSATSRSLLPILEDLPHAPPHELVLCGTQWKTSHGDRCAISADGFKLRQRDLDGDALVDEEELYDLRADPEETTNLVARLPAVAGALRAWIAAEAP